MGEMADLAIEQGMDEVFRDDDGPEHHPEYEYEDRLWDSDDIEDE